MDWEALPDFRDGPGGPPNGPGGVGRPSGRTRRGLEDFRNVRKGLGGTPRVREGRGGSP